MNPTKTHYKFSQIRETDGHFVAIADQSFSSLNPDERVDKCHQFQVAFKGKIDGAVILCWKDAKGNSLYLTPPEWKEILEKNWPFATIAGSTTGEIDL